MSELRAGVLAAPEVYAAWRELNGAIKAGMDLRRYELATIAAARRLRSSYCMLAHGAILADRFMDPGRGAHHRERSRRRRARPARRRGDGTCREGRGRRHRGHAGGHRPSAGLGLPDGEILGVVLAAAARCFFSKTLDGLGALPDHKYEALEPALRDALTVGRPIAAA